MSAAACVLIGCNKMHAVAGEYREQNNPNAIIILKPDGSCQRDDVACTYTTDGNKVTMTMQLMGLVFNGTVDGDRLAIQERNILGGENTTVFVRTHAK